MIESSRSASTSPRRQVGRECGKQQVSDRPERLRSRLRVDKRDRYFHLLKRYQLH